MNATPLTSLPERYIALDPAGDRQITKKTASQSSLVCVAVDDLGRIFVLDCFAQRIPTTKLVDLVYRWNDTWKPKRIGIECVGTQILFVNMVIRDSALKGISVPVVPLPKPTSLDKDSFIRVHVQKPLGEGRLFINRRLTELRSDIEAFPQSPYKDRLDALAHACKMIPPRRSRRQLDTEHDSYLQYLRDSGASPELITAASST